MCHIYRDMKLVRRVAAAEKLAAALAPDATPIGAVARTGRVSFAQDPATGQAGPSTAARAPAAAGQPESAVGPSQEAGVEAKQAAGEPEAVELSPWDPPPRDEHGKVVDTRVFPQVRDADRVHAWRCVMMQRLERSSLLKCI